MRVAPLLAACALTTLANACATPVEPASVAAPGVPAALPTNRPGVQETAGIAAEPRPVARPDPVAPLVLRQRVEARLDAGELPSALVNDASEAARALPSDAAAQRLLAVVLDESGDAAGALLAYHRASALEFHAPSWRRQAALEEAAGDLRGAIATCEALRLQDPDDAGTHLTLASLYEKQERWDAAEQAWREVLRLRPSVPSSLRRHAETLEKLGRSKEARAERNAADSLEEQAAASLGGDRKLRKLPASRR